MPLSSKPEACPLSVGSKKDGPPIFSNQSVKTVDKTPFFDLYSGGVIHLAGRMACADFTATMNGREDVKRYHYICWEECAYIGEGKLRMLIDQNPHGDFYVMNGNRALIKRVKFEHYLDQATVV